MCLPTNLVRCACHAHDVPCIPEGSNPNCRQAEGGEKSRQQDPEDPLRVTFADSLGEVGQYTALIELVYGHEDHFGTMAGALIENKMTMARGGGHPELKLSEEAHRGLCPIGGLAVPRGKVATVIGSMQDVELHELHGVVHMGRTPIHHGGHGGGKTEPTGSSKQARKRARVAAAGGSTRVLLRGCWQRTPDDSEGVFYPEGVALADWLSKQY